MGLDGIDGPNHILRCVVALFSVCSACVCVCMCMTWWDSEALLVGCLSERKIIQWDAVMSVKT